MPKSEATNQLFYFQMMRLQTIKANSVSDQINILKLLNTF